MDFRHEQTSKPAQLPVDYLKMVSEIFTTNFDAGLKALAEIRPNPHFQADGIIAQKEIVLSVSLMHGQEMAATTLYASADFDPKASSPTAEELLSACVDAIGSVLAVILDPEDKRRLEQVAADTLSSLENVPFEWTAMEINRRRVYVKIDKSNPTLERLADDWLAKHDPEQRKNEEEEHSETEKLLFTGPKNTTKH
jgi:hypothetical protein